MNHPATETQDGLTAESVSGWSIEQPGTPTALEPGGDTPPKGGGVPKTFTFGLRDHQGYERRIDLRGVINRDSCVVVSITEVRILGDGTQVPFMGLASMDVDNVVPHDDGILIVRGAIGWDSDLNARLNILVGNPL